LNLFQNLVDPDVFDYFLFERYQNN